MLMGFRVGSVRHKAVVFGVEVMGEVMLFNDSQYDVSVAGCAATLDCGKCAACDLCHGVVAKAQKLESFVKFALVGFVHDWPFRLGC